MSEMVKIEDVCDILDNQRIPVSSDKRKKGIYPYYGANGIQDYVDEYIFDDELVLIAEDGGNFGSKEKPIAYRVSGKCWVNNHAHVLKAKNMLNIDYLCYSLMFYDVSNIVNGATRKKLNQVALRQIKIPLPPLSEQKKIADELDKINILIEKRKEQIEKIDLLVKAKFVEMFGDPVENPMGWDKLPLCETSKIVTGNTPPRNDVDNYGDFIEWIKTDNITSNMYLTKSVECLSEKGAEKARVVDSNAILMACIAGSIKSIGRVAITDRRLAFNQQINAVIPLNYDTMFLYNLFIGTQKYIQSSINMSLKGILSKGSLEKLEFIVPPLPLQNQFADFVQKTEATKLKMQKGLDQLETLYKQRMQKYFE